jgi:peptide/nickel transport system permease protein
MKTLGIDTRLALTVVALLCLAAILSDFLAPYPPDEQNLAMFFAPPTRLHFVDSRGNLHWRPFVYCYALTNALDITYEEIPQQTERLEFFCRGYSYRILGWIPASWHLIGAPRKSAFHPWGTDELGRDVWARALAGARASLIVVVFGLMLYALAGCAVGAFAGLLGGRLDFMLMRLSEFVQSLPALYLILAMRALLPRRMESAQAICLTAGTIAAVTWPPLARGVRGLILQLRNEPYIEAARALGCTRSQIFVRHLIPALAPFVFTQTAVAAPLFLLSEVLLSFLNVGFREGGTSWGSMLRSLNDPRILTDFWWNLAPLGLVFLTLLCLNILSGQRADRLETFRSPGI